MIRERERRGPLRTPFEAVVELRDGGAVRVARARDLGRHGIGLALAAPHPPPGHPVDLEFALPDLDLRVPLAVSAVVAWSDAAGGRLGLRFAGLDPGLAELLDRLSASGPGR
jgi:hypothetical protein